MSSQDALRINFLEKRDGLYLTIKFAKQATQQYKKTCLRWKKKGINNHPFRRKYIESYLFHKNLLMQSGVTMNNEDKFIDICKAAEILNVSPQYVECLINNGLIPEGHYYGYWIILHSDLLAYKEKQTIESRKALDDMVAEAQELEW